MEVPDARIKIPLSSAWVNLEFSIMAFRADSVSKSFREHSNAYL